jgi:hypothetical protein
MRKSWLLLPAAALLSLFGAAAPVQAATSFGFSAPRYVDNQLGGGEPGVIDTGQGTLVYAAHEGTTHLYRPGLTGAPQGDADFVTNYRNQVNLWTSTDHGVNWQRVNWNDTGFFTNPAQNTGFSDPDLTLDRSGRLYSTGIDLANDSLFSSPDGGRTWDSGTVQCHNGDRPWLAGAGPNQVYLATDTAEGQGVNGHEVFVSNDGGNTCSMNGISDAAADGSYAANGKLYFDPHNGNLVEPAVFYDSSGNVNGVGISVLRRGASAFTPIKAASTTMFAHWPAIAIDAADNIYLTWDTDDRVAGTSGGCGGAPSPAANSVKLAVTSNYGSTWRSFTVAHPGTRVLWPWITAGAAGKAAVAWYQTDKLVDPDCEPSAVSVYAAFVQGLNTSRATETTVNAAGRPVHIGSVCQGGTDCVATGKDRRLGDYFEINLDTHGCLLIAVSDTRLTDPATGSPLPTARPLFIRQDAGPSLTNQGPCRP